MKHNRFAPFVALLLLAAALPAGAQTLERFKQRLAEPVGGARVTVTEQGDAAPAVARAAARTSSRKTVRGYRVCIFFDNSPNARTEATNAKKQFEELFPETKVYLIYDNPYWRVTVGNCLTAEEAIILKGRVSATFPKAFLKNEELTLSDLLQ